MRGDAQRRVSRFTWNGLALLHLSQVKNGNIRRKLNQAIFEHIFNSPLAELLAAQHGFSARAAGLSHGDSLDQAIAELVRHSPPTTRGTPKGGSSTTVVENLFTSIY